MQSEMPRLYFMDSMRSILMMLGVVLHSAKVFTPEQSWAVYSNNTTYLAELLVQIIHAFRMESFFMISGFFCFLTIKKYRPKKFLKVRLERIIIPLIFTAITLNSLQTFILFHTGWLGFDFENYIFNGKWVSHLWFLNNLIVYFVTAALLSTLGQGWFVIIGKYLNAVLISRSIIIIIFFMPVVTILILGLKQIGFPLYSELGGVFSTYILFKYLPYFIFGIVLGANRELLCRFSSINPIFSFLVIVSAIFLINNLPVFPDNTQRVIEVYFETLLSWFSVSICFYTFHKFFNVPSSTWLFLSDSSYTVYLFHHILVICLGLILIELQSPALFGMFLLISITLLSTLIIHKYFILRFKTARYLFNGKN